MELELAKILPAMLTLAPVFHLQMYDIAYGLFKAQPFKPSCTKLTVYAIIVCLLTSATNMLVIENSA